MFQKASEYEKVEEYTPPSTLLDIVFIIYIDIILVVCVLPHFITTYFIEWQDDFKMLGEVMGSMRYPRFAIFIAFPMYMVLCFACCNKHIVIKIIGIWCSFSFTQRVIVNGIHDAAIDQNIGLRFREQYYEIMKMLPNINLLLCTILGILIILFKKEKYFDPTKSKVNKIIILSIIVMFGFILPTVIVPIIKPWEWLNFI